MKAYKVLFVCTGNSCRSVMAQALLKQRLLENQKHLRRPVEVLSAGIWASEGMPASDNTIEVLRKSGVDASGHMTRQVSKEMLLDADIILVMEPGHKDEVVRLAPEAAGRVHMLRAFGKAYEVGSQKNDEIADPIGKPAEVYDECFQLIQEAVERLAKALISSQI